jgi:hypothetical protein
MSFVVFLVNIFLLFCAQLRESGGRDEMTKSASTQYRRPISQCSIAFSLDRLLASVRVFC